MQPPLNSPLGQAIEFFQEFGLFDIVLPFLLVFTLVFAILEKTKILGTEPKDDESPRKNLNAMVAFVVGLLVVASNKVVTALNEALPNIVLLLVVFIAFLLLIGTFFRTSEKGFDISQISGWKGVLFGIAFVGVLFSFLGAIRNDAGQTWLEYIWEYILANWSGTVIATIIFFVVAIGAVAYVVSGSKKKEVTD